MKTLGVKHTQLTCYLSYFAGALVSNLMPLLFLILQDRFKISLVQITFLITLNFCIQMLVDLFAGTFTNKLGLRLPLFLAHIFIFLGLIMLAFLPLIITPYVALITATLLLSLGGGLLEALVSPAFEALPIKHKAENMSLLHSFYCIGVVLITLITTLLIQIFGKQNYIFIVLFWSFLPLINSFFFLKVPLYNLVEENTTAIKIASLFKNKLFWLFVLLMAFSGACELSLAQWASAFAERGLNVSKAVGDLLGPMMFAFFMAISRIFYAKMGQKIDLLKFIILSGGLCLLAYILASITNNPYISLLGFSFGGLSVGIFWPGVLSLASKHFKNAGVSLFGFLALAGDLGCTLGPTYVGIISNNFNGQLKYGIFFAAIFPLLLLTSAGILKIYTKNTKESKKI